MRTNKTKYITATWMTRESRAVANKFWRSSKNGRACMWEVARGSDWERGIYILYIYIKWKLVAVSAHTYFDWAVSIDTVCVHTAHIPPICRPARSFQNTHAHTQMQRQLISTSWHQTRWLKLIEWNEMKCCQNEIIHFFMVWMICEHICLLISLYRWHSTCACACKIASPFDIFLVFFYIWWLIYKPSPTKHISLPSHSSPNVQTNANNQNISLIWRSRNVN